MPDVELNFLGSWSFVTCYRHWQQQHSHGHLQRKKSYETLAHLNRQAKDRR